MGLLEIINFRDLACSNIKRLVLQSWKFVPPPNLAASLDFEQEAGGYENVTFNEKDCPDFEDKYELVLKGIEELKAKVANVELIDNQTIQRSASPSQGCADNRVPSRTNKVLSPLVTRRRGHPSTKRKIPRIEEVIRKLKNKKKVQQVKENICSKKSRTKKENPYTFESSRDHYPKM
ncbi:hypothetical protein CCACVL1_30849 [Corchorus capsularis]|uniref:Uncharacterized protein n=1 Tax=Corchorus capsularis TaxID=210143 RepID=A0A1R3FVD4_COCAP|nr:hypothetical protein CCACVL1_30849 [Corchorus capsularis]